MAPAVSILIPFRDKIDLLNTCLETMQDALGDEKKDVEVLLLDNGSSEESLRAIRIPSSLSCRTIRLDIPFNFQTINNRGAAEAAGRFLLFLNNDIVFTRASRGFLGQMINVAADPGVGAVGPLLLYEDGTIQHAGVVVGMGGYADHLYRTWGFVDAARFPFSGPREDREVSAVTAACLMVEKSKFDAVNGFDERFIVCGGDVDLCLRLCLSGRKNVYLGGVEMIHLESKSRDASKIPEVDFRESRRSYDAFLTAHNGRDPFYPQPLPLQHSIDRDFLSNWRGRLDASERPPGAQSGPDSSQNSSTALAQIQSTRTLGDKFARAIRRFKALRQAEGTELAVARTLVNMRRRIQGSLKAKRLSDENKASQTRLLSASAYRSVATLGIPHMKPVRFHWEPSRSRTPRLTVLLPHLEEKGIFGGIATAALLALKFKIAHPSIRLRFALTEGEGSVEALERVLGSYFSDELSRLHYEIRPVYDRNQAAHSLSVSENDFFLATAWWTCYSARAMSKFRPFLYLVQDYEPCFYPWGEEFVGAENTYKMDFVPIFNSASLRDFFQLKHLLAPEVQARAMMFEPAINPNLFGPREARIPHPSGKRIVFLYGRPSVARNLFSLACQALALSIEKGAFPSGEWSFFSAGEPHEPVNLGKGCVLNSLGKLSLSEYSQLLKSTDVGLSLMVSPHPSYPPLEIASRGALCVTNRYENKDLSVLHENIISCNPDDHSIAEGLVSAYVRATQSNQESVKPRCKLSYSWDDSLRGTIATLAEVIRDDPYRVR